MMTQHVDARRDSAWNVISVIRSPATPSLVVSTVFDAFLVFEAACDNAIVSYLMYLSRLNQGKVWIPKICFNKYQITKNSMNSRLCIVHLGQRRPVD